GHHGGAGMAGTGKRADHKKTLINNLYGNDYFGKQGITSKGTKRDRRKRINIGDIERNMQSYVKRGLAKKTKDGFELNLEDYKILGEGEIKNKVTVKAMEASESAIKKIESVGGKIIVKKISEKENKSEDN
ncbi:MAG TPA: uL15m family ribosomal protein, partial [archaeon]|nr:uL15m family ribosomal protein [archaeon]